MSVIYLEMAIALEMDILMELEPEDMDTQETATTTTNHGVSKYEEQDMDMEYQLEEEYETYEDWLMQELEEMGIVWDQENMDTMEESVMVVGRHEFPPSHGGVSSSSQSPPIIAENGVEVGDVSDGHLTEDGEVTRSSLDTLHPPQTPRLSGKLSGLCV